MIAIIPQILISNIDLIDLVRGGGGGEGGGGGGGGGGEGGGRHPWRCGERVGVG